MIINFEKLKLVRTTSVSSYNVLKLLSVGRRVWLQITDFDLEVGDSSLEVSLGDGTDLVTPFRARPHLSDGMFVSAGERVQLRLKTGDNPHGRGFRAVYKSGNVYAVY